MPIYTGDGPCAGLPGFLQPHESRNWRRHPETIAAQSVCENLCPRNRFRGCALAALSAGTLDDANKPQVADGVVMAGIVCSGDAATERALRNVLRDHTPIGWRATRPTHCLGCERPMTTRKKKDPGHVIHESVGLCTACCRAQKRSA